MENRRGFFLLVVFLGWFLVNGQSLYWIGGNGSYNDAAHWSFSSGGKSAAKVPDVNTNVIFDDHSGLGEYRVKLDGICKSRNFFSRSVTNRVIFAGGKDSQLQVAASLTLSALSRFEAQTPVYFNYFGGEWQQVDFGISILNCNLHFGAGSFIFKPLHLNDKHTISFGAGRYHFKNVTLVAGNFLSESPAAKFIISSSLFRISDKVKIVTTDFDAEDLNFQANVTSTSDFEVPKTVGSSKKINLNTILSCPQIVISSSPSCSGPCSGVLSIFIPSTCAAGPYDVLVSNAACSTEAAAMSISGLTTPTTYIVPNACPCMFLNYQVIVFDSAGTVAATKNENFLANPITVTGTTFAPKCSSVCNGSITGSIFGSGPFSVTVLPSTVTPSSFSTNLSYSLTNLCPATYTLNVSDVAGCSATATRVITAPLPINPNAVTQSISCNSFSTGSFSVSPTNGAPNYTVVFSTGATLTVGSGGTVGVNNLPAGAVSAVITDSNGCTANVSTVIAQPGASISIVPSQTNISCGGACTGAALVNVSGGGGSYTYTWSPAGGSGAGATGLCAGITTLTLRDNNNCLRTQTFNITQPTSITINSTITPVICSSSCTGGATVTASGPAPPITFTWLAASNGSVITNGSSISGQCAGAYTLQSSATSDPTCVVNRIINIVQPPAITLTPITQSITCRDLCSGAATVVSAGGNGAPYTYTWLPGGASTSTSNSLCAGPQTVTVRDASNCAVTTSFTIQQPAAFAFGVTTGSVTCNGLCNGVINASPSGGTAPYTYTLASASSTVTSGSPIFTGLCAGTYTLFVRDNLSTCAQQTTVSVLQPNALAGSVATTSISCFGVCNGAFAGSASGGTPPYSMIWTTPGGTVSGGAINSLCAGNYSFNVMDGNNCVAPTTTLMLMSPPDITVSIGSTMPSCSSLCNGILTATVLPSASYTLNWVNNGFSGNPNTGLCADLYTLTATNTNGCVKTATFDLVAPPEISISQTISSTRCAGSCDGSVTLTAVGGTGTFTYQINSSPLQTNLSGIMTNLCAGSYIASATDANGCVRSANISVVSPAALSAALTNTRNSCSSCTGGATVTASNGTAPYAFAWTNSVNVSAGTGSAISNFCPGNYTVLVTDSRSCTATASLAIGQIVIAAAVSGGVGIQCFGVCSASAVAVVSGGQAPYNFTWSPGAQSTGTAVNLCAGNYTVNISDSGVPACSSTAAITVSQPADLIITTSQTNITCFNSCNGALGASVTGGTGVISYSWSPGGQTTSTISGLCAGSYTLRVTDGNGCTKPPVTFTLAAPFPAITATLNATDPSQCIAPNNGSICVTPGGGTGAFNYTWSPAVAGNTSCASSLIAGTYSVIIASGVCTNTFFTTLSNPSGPALTQVTLQPVSCFNGNNGAISYSAAGTGPFTFTWTPAVSFTNSGATSSASGLSSGTYVIGSSDANQCTTTQTVFVAQSSSVIVNTSLRNISCNGGVCNGSVGVNPSGGVAPYTFTWSSGANSSSITSLCAGAYTLTLRDNNLCTSTHTFGITMPAAVTVTAIGTDIRCNAACNGSITSGAGGGTGILTYSWLPSGTFLGSSTPTILNLCAALYTLNVIDANGCLSSTIVPITEPPLLSSTLNFSNATCSNLCNGSASLNASGGVPGYTFSWSNGGSSGAAISNLCAGNYTGTVTDANGCQSAQGFTVQGASPFSATLTPTHPLCNASCNGSINTSISGAQGTVIFSWTPAGTGQNPVNLCASSYTLVAVDANSCQVQSAVTLTNPPAILANVNFTNPTCNGNCDGVAISIPINANAPVNYSWLPSGPNSATNSALCAGVYTVTAVDNNGCNVTQTFVIAEPSLLNVNASTGPASCGSSNGTITAVPVGGTPSYTFAWTSPVSPPIVTSGSVVTNIPAGIYTVQITDANNCTNTVTIPLSNSNGPVAPLTATNVLCNGACTGAASVGIISSGTSPYAVPVWIIPTPTVQSSYLSNLCAGNYTVELRDNLNCVTYTGTSISQPPPVSILPVMSLPLCTGVCNGSVTINTTGGVSPYTYTWTPGAATGSAVTNLCAGTYSILVGYNSGACVSPPIILTVPAASSFNIAPPSVTPNNCFADCTGSATINLIPGNGLPVGPVTYNWSNGQSGTSANNLCTGNYSVLISDSQGCNNTFSVGITSPPQITVNAVVSQPDCGRCNGSATVTAGGGTGPTYTFDWTNGDSGITAGELCAGVYQVLVTDAANCKNTQDIIINNSDGITGENILKQDVNCAGECNGSATVTATGGSNPISYNWLASNPPNSSSSATSLCSGIHYVQMTDAAGCARTASVQINASVNISLATYVTPSSCNPVNNGSVIVVPAGGTPSYSYSWSPALSTTSVLLNAGAGAYTVTVSDFNGLGCSVTRIIPVSNSAGPQLSAVQQNNSCAQQCVGSITVSSSSGTVPVYSWSNGNTGTVVTNLCSGIISVTATAGGCSSVRTFTITDNEELRIETVTSQVLCGDQCSGSVHLQARGGTLPYTFSWTPINSTVSMIDSLCAGNYSFTVTDINGCSISGSDTIIQRPAIVVTSTVVNSSCNSVADGALSVSVTGGTPDYNYLWTGPGSFTSTAQNLTQILSGTYSLTVRDSADCLSDTSVFVSASLSVTANAGIDLDLCPGTSATLSGVNSQNSALFEWYNVPPVSILSNSVSLFMPNATQSQTFILVAYGSNTVCSDTDEVVMNVYTEPYLDAGPSFTIPLFSTVTIGGQPTSLGIETITWSPAFTLNDANAQNPVSTTTTDITYTVSLAYGNGCIVSDTMRVLLYPEIKITSGFSPNDDGKNDKWVIDHIDQFPDNTVEIFNRWGEPLFYARGYGNSFDGTHNGKNLPVGTYYYVIHLHHPSYPKPYIGPLTIFR